MQKASERIFLMPIRLALLPEVKDMNMPVQGVAHNLTLVQIEKAYPGQGMKTISSMWGAGQMMLNKILLVTDMPVDNYRELARQTLARIDFHTDLLFGRGPLDVLDHSSPHFAFGSKLGIDATEDHKTVRPQDHKTAVSYGLTVLRSYGLTVSACNFNLLDEAIPIAILAVHEPTAELITALGSQLLSDEELVSVKLFILLDDTVDIFDLDTVCWLACANTDPERDIRLALAPRQQMVVDACMKRQQSYGFPRECPDVVAASEETVKIIDEKWKQFGLGDFISSPSVRFLKTGNDNASMSL
jgi:4-hydroxy-3-polyprenylbenzoate decarboxylase